VADRKSVNLYWLHHGRSDGSWGTAAIILVRIFVVQGHIAGRYAMERPSISAALWFRVQTQRYPALDLPRRTLVVGGRALVRARPLCMMVAGSGECPFAGMG
jgi:hypothetical protein